MKLLIVTDTFLPSINGVVTTLNKTIQHIKNMEIKIIHPGLFKNVDCPLYKEVKIPLTISISKIIDDFNPDYIHISTEGYLGLLTKFYCHRKKYKYTTAYHTCFPEYFEKYFKINKKYFYKYFRWFHKSSSNIMVSTQSIKKLLVENGFNNISYWTRGVDTTLFNTNYENIFNYDGPILLNVGRVSKEKNLDSFCKLKGTKILVGDGPDLERLKYLYPDVIFMGAKTGIELAAIYKSCDVFVFPSKTDTFGLVIIEALASGLPVAAYNVHGPKDILTEKTGHMSTDLQYSVEQCLKLNKKDCINYVSENYTWEIASKQFLNNLVKKL